MATCRVPLASNPNAANSPYRAPTTGKRARATTHDQDDVSPPKKRQLLRVNQTGSRAAPSIVAEEPRCGVFAERLSASQPSSFQKKLAAARDGRYNAQQLNGEKGQKPSSTDTVTFQNWRKYYWNVFPTYVIYFESLPNDVGSKAARQIYALGARREKFFSKDVTHVVTTRVLPQENKQRDGRSATSSRASVPSTQMTRADTIDPAMLHKVTDAQSRSRLASSAHPLKRNQLPVNDGRQQSSADILQKAHDMGIKIWTYEKLERMMLELLTNGCPPRDEPLLRAPADPPALPSKRDREADLSQLLREEKNAPTERKVWQELVPFRGCYIYIHDMEEKVKPVMIRDYARPAKNEDGEWPQFRSVSKGRCPFVEEPPQPQRGEKERSKAKAATVSNSATHSRASVQQAKTLKNQAISCEAPRTRSTIKSPQKRVLQEHPDQINQMAKPSAPASLVKPFEPPRLVRQASTGIDNMPPMLGSAQANFRGIPRNPGGEPLASGVQQNVTSAIRSQMFSSTAPSAPGVRAGMNKQHHQMSRRVLERQSGFSANSMPSSLTINDVRAAINNDRAPAQRHNTRQRAAERMSRIHEDETLSEDEEHGIDANEQEGCIVRKKQPAKREAKPGYCENCREKYGDFNQHITSKKHRKFALCDDNFSELDALLNILIRR